MGLGFGFILEQIVWVIGIVSIVTGVLRLDPMLLGLGLYMWVAIISYYVMMMRRKIKALDRAITLLIL